MMFHKINGQWQWGESFNDQKGLVQNVTLKIGECAGNENSKCKLEQPIDKIVLSLESDNVNDFQEWVPFPPLTNNHKLFQDNYLEGSHVKLDQDGVHLGVNIRCNRETCLTPKKLLWEF